MLRRQQYIPIESNAAAAEESTGATTSTASTALETSEGGSNENDALMEAGGAQGEDLEEDDGRRLTVVILDVAQKKFRVTVHPQTSVAKFKREGSRVHKVSSDRQRLIYRGRMLADEKTLEEEGITSDEVIVHLFPKPRVVIKDSTNTASGSSDPNSANEEEDEDEVGARVPTIVLEADEAERRTQILVLGSQAYVEAQNNIKLFSFMLLVISSVELISLLAIALGVPQEDPGSSLDTVDTDDFFPHNTPTPTFNNTGDSDDGLTYEPWTNVESVDLVISLMGVYVGILGLQATSLNTLRLARLYLVGTAITGTAWLLFNYVMTFKINKEQNEEREANNDDNYLPKMDDTDLRLQALSVMTLPAMVWILCCLRAWQFQQLLLEAGQEAEERIRSELEQVEGSFVNPGSTGAQEEDEVDEESALQNESARMT